MDPCLRRGRRGVRWGGVLEVVGIAWLNPSYGCLQSLNTGWPLVVFSPEKP
jgi:hypothetical protein